MLRLATSSFETIKCKEFLKFCPTIASTTLSPLIYSSMYKVKEPCVMALIFYLTSIDSISSWVNEWIDRTFLKKSNGTFILRFYNDGKM